jgi:hypothetical protein
MTKFLPLVAILTACTSMEPSGSPLTPVRVTAAPSARPVAAPEGPTPAVPPNSPFAEDDPFLEGPEDPAKAPSGTDAWLRLQLENADNPPAPTPEVKVIEAPAPAPSMPVWDGQSPLQGDGSWGVTLLATMVDVQPPRAVLVFPDATERVVQPGTMMPDHHLVVLAIGRDAVQIAHIEPMGFMSRVQTSTVRKLSDGG